MSLVTSNFSKQSQCNKVFFDYGTSSFCKEISTIKADHILNEILTKFFLLNDIVIGLCGHKDNKITVSYIYH